MSERIRGQNWVGSSLAGLSRLLELNNVNLECWGPGSRKEEKRGEGKEKGLTCCPVQQQIELESFQEWTSCCGS